MILTAAVFLIFMVLVYAIPGSGNNSRYDSDGYHEDPYYYYPNHAAPRYGGGYQQPYYPQHYPPQYQQYPPQFQQPYPQQYQQPYQPSSMRPQEAGNSLGLGMVMFLLLVLASFTIAVKMGVASAVFTFGDPNKESLYQRQEQTPMPESHRREGDYQIYSKDAPRK